MRIFRYLMMVLAVAALAAPAAARAADGSILTYDDIEHGQGFRNAAGSDYNNKTVNISPGERVTFSYPTGNGAHNVGFVPGGLTPASCIQTAGQAILAAPPLPQFPMGAGWSGYCTFTQAGTYDFFCTAHGDMTGKVVVGAAANQPPTVTTSRTPTGSVATGATVSFTATGSDPDGDTLSYSWDFGDGTAASTQQNPAHAYSTAGTKTATVTVSDGKGGAATSTQSVVVTQANQAPTVTAGRTPAGDVAPGTAITFAATGTDADGDTLSYSWDFGDTTAASTQQNPVHTYTTAGTYTAKVTVSDGKGGTGSTTVPVTVASGSSGCIANTIKDDFNGSALGSAWSVVRQDATLVVGNGVVTIPTQAGDLYQTANSAKNVVLRTAPTGAWTMTAKINQKGLVQYQQGGIILYGDDDNYVKLDRTATNTATATNTEFFEFIEEVAGTPRNATADHTGNLVATYPQDFYLRMVWDGTSLTGFSSPDGSAWTAVGRASTAMPTTPKVGFFALSNAAATTVDAKFDSWQITGPNVDPGCTPGPNTAPVVSSAARTPTGDVATGTALAFTAAATDADGDLLSYAWDFGNGATSTAQNPTYTYTTAGTYTAKVTVSDGRGGSDSKTLPITVTQPNRAPTVTGSRTPTGVVAPGTSIAFSAVGSDADSDTLSYSWDFGDGTAASTEQNPSHTYNTAATYTARVTVSDGRGATGTSDVTVNVAVPGSNNNPTVTSSRTPTGNVAVGIAVSFSSTGNDPDGDTLTYSWNFGDSTAAVTTQNATHTFTTAGTYNVVVTVSDGKGGTGSATALAVTVTANRAPTISSATATGNEGFGPLNVTFAATAADADGHTLTYQWDLDGDGTFETTGQNPTKTYTASAAPVLRVSDGNGGVATRTLASAPNGGGVNVFPTTLDPNARYHVLVFSKTAAFRHSAIDEAEVAIAGMGKTQNFTVDWTEDATRFNDAFLGRYDLVVFNSTTGDVLTDDQQAAFERFIKAGHGYAGIHSATDTEYGWAWYGQMTGAYFRDHPNGTPTATVVVEDPNSPATAGLPARWSRVDEWYNFQTNVNPVVNGGGTDVSPRGNTPIHVLLTMDESTYVENDGNTTDDDHPIAWCKRYDGGRMFYTALGHTEATYTDPLFLGHLKGGMEVAAGVVADADCGQRAPVASASRVPATAVQAGTPVQFNSTASDADGDTLTYAWDFGDGGTSTAANPTHTFAQGGDYAVKLTVSDGHLPQTVTVPTTITAPSSTNIPGDVGGNVDLVLALSVGSPTSFPTFVPGVGKDYLTTAAAQVTSTAGSATLSVSDPSTTNTGKLVNGTYVLAQPLQVNAINTANPSTAFAPVTGADTPLVLLNYPRAMSSDAVTLGFKQTVGAGETLRAGAYAKTLRFTLSTTTP